MHRRRGGGQCKCFGLEILILIVWFVLGSRCMPGILCCFWALIAFVQCLNISVVCVVDGLRQPCCWSTEMVVVCEDSWPVDISRLVTFPAFRGKGLLSAETICQRLAPNVIVWAEQARWKAERNELAGLAENKSPRFRLLPCRGSCRSTMEQQGLFSTGCPKSVVEAPSISRATAVLPVRFRRLEQAATA